MIQHLISAVPRNFETNKQKNSLKLTFFPMEKKFFFFFFFLSMYIEMLAENLKLKSRNNFAKIIFD